MEEKACTTCGQSFPNDKKHFPKLEAACRACVYAKRKIRDQKAAARRAKALQKIEEAGVDLYAGLATEGGSNIPHSAEVLERLFQYFGGVAGFSSIVVKQYYDSPAGGTARNRLIETIVRLVSKNVEQGGVKKPLSLWTEAELEAELEQRFKQALTTYKGVTVDVKALPSPEDTSAASDPDNVGDDAVPDRRDQDAPVGTAGAETGSPPAVPADRPASADARLHGS